ncbi:hypothetical protein C4587_00530 [Candidatus Parcubacteria bacterium]|nr:MAG: hypothetical protein C4587_00530 [Candidatus Parcubacteria bacterium]
MRHLRRRTGLSLIELLVTISLTTLLSSLVIAYSNIGRRQVTLSVEASKIAQTVLRAKALAISTYNQPIVPCGYGVEVDYALNTYALYSYDAPSCSSIASVNPVQKMQIERSGLSPGLVFELRPDSLRDVIFLPPDPRTLLSVDPAGSFTNSPAVVYMKTVDGLASAAVTVNVNGQVTF